MEWNNGAGIQITRKTFGRAFLIRRHRVAEEIVHRDGACPPVPSSCRWASAFGVSVCVQITNGSCWPDRTAIHLGQRIASPKRSFHWPRNPSRFGKHNRVAEGREDAAGGGIKKKIIFKIGR